MIRPTVDDILRSVIATIEDEISPSADEYAASLCRTSAQMLRHVAARLQAEVPALVADTDDLRRVLAGLARDVPSLEPTISEAIAAKPLPKFPALSDLQADAVRLRGLLVDVIDESPEVASPARAAARAYARRYLERELPWQQDAYTGPRR
jgi:hypothetical protein